MTRGRFRLVLTGGTGAVAMLVAGCTVGGGEGSLTSGGSGEPVTITPANGTAQVKPDGTIEVKASDGELQKVTVQGKGATVTGRFGDERKTWRSDRTMTPGTSYTVTAQVRDDGETRTSTSSFTTLKADKTLKIADVTPNRKGEKVGVGMPIMVTFDGPVANKAAVERTLSVTPDKAVEGAWRWDGADKVVYRPKTYWQPHQTVRFHAKLAGVNAGGGVYGAQDEQVNIALGAAQITTGNIGKHRMTVTRDGKKVRTLPFSAGNGQTREYTTTSGVHLLMEKANPVTMTSPGRKPGDPGYYKQVVNHGVRFSWSGQYTHSAPWSVGSQGSANVSHGCINLSPSDARWYYDIAQRGDVLKLTGSDRRIEDGNGWTQWEMSFDEWRQGSALS
ncbi:Ig-like domain-containing protein [Actinomadura sp. KC345]|uniref:L,D-transpeptidase n=1 Tax=Actinomadura sp. KC345 TaxID=2530371 RepID=UPI001FB6F535|nr:Ig-like domain-containing protein [Actinomadura sp. KC345]